MSPTEDIAAPVASPALPTAMPSRREAFAFWLRLGFISFGGPAGQIAIMHAELVERRRWISEKRFLHALNYCMLLPGPEAQQLATYLGWLMHRTTGGIVAGALFVLPSLLILILLSWVYLRFGHTALVAGLFHGIKPAVLAIVALAAHRIGTRALRGRLHWGIALSAFLAMALLQAPFPALLAGAALLGAWFGRQGPMPVRSGAAAHQPERQPPAPGLAGVAPPPPGPAALIDDDTPPPAHARFRWSRLAMVATTGALLWLLPISALLAGLGWQHALTQMAWFFTKAALLTFGGAYAVLPYVYQGAVLQQGWLTPAQMMDGLALGENTPGPLIMVVAFVGFVGGYVQALFGADQQVLAGAAAAALVTWFTFLPSFVFILAGGPLVESSQGRSDLSAPLAAITAAVVGAILNLALFFARQTLWPRGIEAGIDLAATLIALGAALALLRFKRSVIEVIAACAVAGLLLSDWRIRFA